jgi:hypothetical protein
MSTATFLSDPIAVGKLLFNLMDRPVNVKRITPTPAPRGVLVVASYAHDDGSSAGICWMDMPAAGSAAAALTLTPVSIVDESVKSGKLLAPLDENVREVLNICARLFASAESHRVYLSEVYLPPAKVPATLMASIAKPATTIQVDMAINGYRPGKMGFIAV